MISGSQVQILEGVPGSSSPKPANLGLFVYPKERRAVSAARGAPTILEPGRKKVAEKFPAGIVLPERSRNWGRQVAPPAPAGTGPGGGLET